jgi:hypothetical protein
LKMNSLTILIFRFSRRECFNCYSRLLLEIIPRTVQKPTGMFCTTPPLQRTGFHPSVGNIPCPVHGFEKDVRGFEKDTVRGFEKDDRGFEKYTYSGTVHHATVVVLKIRIFPHWLTEPLFPRERKPSLISRGFSRHACCCITAQIHSICYSSHITAQ